MEEERLDKILIQRKLVSTRVLADKIIRETGVKVNGKLISKPGKRFPLECEIEMMADENPWVSREAVTLVAAIEKWKPTIKEGSFLDIGAAAGGFTEVLLKNGASKVICVDLASKKLHPSIASDERVLNLDNKNVREITPVMVPDLNDGCVIDVSMVSLEKIFPFVHAFIKPMAFVIVLVKPQFEVGKKNLGKGGIVKDIKLFPAVIQKVIGFGKLTNLEYVEHIESPILGSDGNREFLMLLKRTAV